MSVNSKGRVRTDLVGSLGDCFPLRPAFIHKNKIHFFLFVADLIKSEDDDPMVSLTQFCVVSWCTVIFLSLWTERAKQTVYTQIRLLLEEQSDRVCTVCMSVCIF